MSTYKTLYCRFCAEQKTHDMLNLKSELEIRNEIIEKLTYFNIDYVDFSNGHLPETVCTSCYSTLNTAYDFFTKIKISQDVLSNLSFENFKTEYNADEESNHSYDDARIKLENSLSNSDNSKIYKSNDTKDFYSKINLDVPSNQDFPFNCFNDEKSADSSKIDISWSSYPWICKYCNVNVNNINSLRIHSRDEHSLCFGVRCVDCDVDIDSFDVFVDHVREHRECLIHFCQYCNIKLEDDQSHHISEHVSQPNCGMCGEIFTNEITLQHHHNLYLNRKTKKLSRHKMSTLKELLSYGVEIYEPNNVDVGSWKDYPWVCQFCSTKCPDQETLRSHTKEVHRKCFGMKCVDCVIGVDSFAAFIDHVRVHRPGLKYYCQYCDYRFDDPQQSIIHITDHLESQMQCEACGKAFANRADLQKHISTYNPPKSKRIPFKKRERPITVEDLTCDICQKVAKSLTNLRAHKKLHTERHRDYTCDRCGKAFFTKGALSAHNMIHENPEPQICKICKKSFLTLTRLKKHVKTHYGEKPFQCGECHRCFRLKEQLKGHMITHTDLMPYSCQYCDKAFKHKNVLKNHENQHTGARPYSCDVCNMDFANWSNCNKHMKRKHGTTLAKNIMTPQGKLPINPKTGKPRKLKDLDMVKEWTEQIMVPCKRGKKTGSDVA